MNLLLHPHQLVMIFMSALSDDTRPEFTVR